MNDLLRRRRAMMAQKAEEDEWITILPVNPNQDGRGVFAEKSISLTAGDVLTIEYYGITDRLSSRIFVDGYYARTTEGGETRNILNCSMLTSDDGTRVLTATRDGTVKIGGSRNDADGSLTAYFCKMIRIKVN